MSVLVWWVLPAAATLVAVCWAAWVRRGPRSPSDVATIDGYARFRAALATPTPDVDPALRRNGPDAPTA